MPAARELAGVEMSLVGELGRELFLRDALHPVAEDYEHVVIDTPPNLGMLTVNALVCADVVLAPVSAEDEASLHGIREVRRTIDRLTERLPLQRPALLSLLTRWQRHRLSSRSADRELTAEGLSPASRIPSRSALLARAAARHVPFAIVEPDSSPALAYAVLTDLVFEEVSPR
jgi:chromosome partitioning protein